MSNPEESCKEKKHVPEEEKFDYSSVSCPCTATKEELELYTAQSVTHRGYRKYTMASRVALAYYNRNFNKDDKFTFKELIIGSAYVCPEYVTAHINFSALSTTTGVYALFFAEVNILDKMSPLYESDIIVVGCCQLRKISDVNLHGMPCNICFHEGQVIHPGPRQGHIVASGDPFLNATFQQMGDVEMPGGGNFYVDVMANPDTPVIDLRRALDNIVAPYIWYYYHRLFWVYQ